MAFTLVWADVVNVAPDLSSLTVAQQNAVLFDVDTQLAETKLGTRYFQACRYLAAHLGTLVKRGATGAGGVVSSESVGAVSVSYSVPSSSSDDGLGATVWGMQYKRIIRLSANRIGSVL
jgi:hypothetical protein